MDFVFEQIVFSKRDRQFHIQKPSRLILTVRTAPVARKGMVTPATPICAFCLEAVALRPPGVFTFYAFPFLGWERSAATL